VGFVSGPFQCWEDFENQSMFTAVGIATFLPTEFGCIEMGTVYSPTISGETMSFPKYKTSLQVIVECQNFCMSIAGCAHFSISTSARRCTLAEEGAKRSSNIAQSLAGPPSCFSRTSRVGQADKNGNSGSRATWANDDNSSVRFLREFLSYPGSLRARSSGFFACSVLGFLLVAGVLTVNRRTSCRTPYFVAAGMRYAELPMSESTTADEARLDVADMAIVLPVARV
jgi:hypothetical protein